MTTSTAPTDSHALRSVAKIYPAPAPHWVGDGFHVHGYFSSDPGLDRALSPFLLLDYHAPEVYAPNLGAPRGVGPHPHRGFETVSVAFAGSIAHHDSAGNGGEIHPGDVQWMTAGGGILHQEYHAPEYSRNGGNFHGAQIWVNLPRANKMTAPTYQHLAAASMGEVILPDNGGKVRVIAGAFEGVQGPARTTTPIDMFDVVLNAKASLELRLPSTHNTAILVMAGNLAVNGEQNVKLNEFVTFNHDGAQIRLEAQSNAHFLVLSGEPIAEPIERYGPFVMNTKAELIQAVDDFNTGKFGYM